MACYLLNLADLLFSLGEPSLRKIIDLAFPDDAHERHSCLVPFA